MMRIGRRSVLALAGRTALGLAAVGLAAGPARAEGEQLLVDQARITVDTFAGMEDMQGMRNMLARAKAVMVFPELLKGGFIIGGEGGSGLLLARNGQSGEWGAPAFYAMFAGSIGLQIGGEVSQVMLLIMTDKGLEAVFRNEFKLGGDASLAVGPVGRGVEASATTNMRDDIYAFSISKGLFGGVSLEGAVINARHSRNQAYYGRALTPRDIVMGPPGAAGTERLRGSLRAAAVAAK